MFTKKKRKPIVIIILLSIMITMLPITPTQEVSAAFIGNDGALPGGGSLGEDGGMCPGTIYRIGAVTEWLSDENAFDSETDNNDSITEKLNRHYSNHMPNMQNSIMFVPDNCYTTSAAVGWYDSSTGKLIVNKRNITGVSVAEAQERVAFHDARVRNLKPSNTDLATNGIFYNALLSKTPISTPGDLSALEENGWKSVIDTVPSSGTKSKQVWDYVFGRKDEIPLRLKTFIGEDFMDSDNTKEDHHIGSLKFLDALITLYVLSPEGDQKDFYSKTIERYLEKRDLNTNPALFAVDTAVRFSSPSQLGNTYVYVPSTSYVNYMHGASPTNTITNPDFNPNISGPTTTKKLIEASARKSMAALSSRGRKTDLPEDTDGFSWAYSGVVGDALRTNTSTQSVSWRTSTNVGIMESIYFIDSSYFGFMIAGGIHNKGTIIDYQCECSQSVSIDKKDIEGKLEGNIIGKKLPLLINMKQNDSEKLQDWKDMLEAVNEDTLQIRVRLWRSQAPEDPIWGPSGAKPIPIDGNADGATDHWDTISKAQLLKYLADGDTLHYEDDLTAYEIPDDVNQEFRYNASVAIKGEFLSGEEFFVECDQDDSLSMFVEGPTSPEPEKGHYSSFPEFWSEIKQGSPGNETFEAMAGTPTTRSLYFASGGSEFIVDIEVEYVPDVTSKRTYRSYFTGGVPSEFKEGDQAGDYTVPSPSGANSSSLTVNAHRGGTVTATWTGTTPYIGDLSWSDHTSSGADKWNDDPYKNAKDQAQDWADAVNAFVIKHKADSDDETREFSNWGASITSDSNTHPAGYVNIGQDYVAPTPCSGDPCTGGDPGQPYIATTGAQGTDGTYSITVKGTVPAQIIDGPSSMYDLPMVEDTWTQEINYDYTKINDLKVWKIERSKVNGMGALTSTNEITASIVQGDPTVFYNIVEDPSRLEEEASAVGRLRHSLEPNQHDTVVWNEGPRTNKDDGNGVNLHISGPGQGADWATGTIYTNNGYSTDPDYHVANSTSDDKQTVEWKKFEERRKSLNEVTAISDFLILQTSSGDQSVMYFEKSATPTASQDKVEIPKTSFEVQWVDNPLSAANWEKDHINIGSYNGDYLNPDSKYSTTGTTRVETKFDEFPAGLNRTERPSGALRLMETGIDVIDTIPNKEYIIGTSDLFYESIINHGDKPPKFSVSRDSKYDADGHVFGTTYSDHHSKVNDIVIHNPVSVERALVIPLPDHRDQRTDSTKTLGGNLQEPVIEYERRLKPGYVFVPQEAVYETRTVPNPNYVPPSEGEEILFNYTGNAQSYTATQDGTYTLEVWGAEGGANSFGDGGAGGYVKGQIDLTQGQSLSIYVGGKGGDKTGNIDQYNRLNDNGGWNGGGSGAGNAGPGGGGATDIRISDAANESAIYNWDFVNSNLGFTSGTTSVSAGTNVLDGVIDYSDGYFYSPSISVAGETQDVIEIRVKNESAGTDGQIYWNWGSGYSESYVEHFSMTGNDSGYKTYRISVGTHSYWEGRNISRIRFDLANGTSSGRFYVDYIKLLRTTSQEERIIVGGGGGGGEHSYNYGGNTSNLTSTSQGGNGCTGWWGSENQYEGDNGGGGGGYLGGQGSCSDDGRIGYGGSNYAGSLANSSMQDGIRTGNGLAKITMPSKPGIGSPTMETRVLVTPAVTEPPEDAYEYIEIIHDPAEPVETPLGTFSPGNFINLDYSFTIHFPNVGNFYGNGAHGITSTTDITGKGFIDNMNTTEWTKSKQVKFQFFATYNGKTYAPNTWIDLDVHEDDFEFYLPLANSEAISALVEFRAIAINALYPDGDSVKNKGRGQNLAADHSAIKAWNIDIVGRIGALVIEDTGDFRFSNLFKQPLNPTEWFIPNVVRKVNSNAQNFIVGDSIDVRGHTATAANNYLDTYGLLPHLRQNPIPLPLSPSQNNIAALRNQPMRVGYKTFADIQTIGNYHNKMQIIPYYYSLNLDSGTISPVDIYMSVDGSYEPINKFGVAVPGWDPASVYPYIYSLDWSGESGRRNYTEASHTNHLVEDSTLENGDGSITSLGKPRGSNHPFGTAQIMHLNERNRTFMGTHRTNGVNRNPGGVIPLEEFGKQGQRWHFTYGLPSSAIAVHQGEPVNQSTIDLIRNNKTVLIAALDIKSVGDTYVLQYTKDNGSISVGGRNFSLSSIPHPVVTVYSAHRSSVNDLRPTGTH